MKFHAVLLSQLVKNTWDKKGIRPFVLHGIPFYKNRADGTYRTEVLEKHQIDALKDCEDVVLGVTAECVAPVGELTIVFEVNGADFIEKGEDIPLEENPVAETVTNTESTAEFVTGPESTAEFVTEPESTPVETVSDKKDFSESSVKRNKRSK